MIMTTIRASELAEERRKELEEDRRLQLSLTVCITALTLITCTLIVVFGLGN